MISTQAISLKNRISSITWGVGLLWVILVFGVMVRARAFLEGRSLWLDEAALAVFFIDRSLFGSLTLGLPNGQSAPPGLLFLTEVIVQVLGLSEFTFRLFPFVSGVASLFAAYFLAKNSFPSLIPRAFFLSAISFSPVLIYYSTEFKQYSFDVLAVTTVLLVASAKKKVPTWLLSAGIFFIAITSLPGILAIALFFFLAFFGSKSRLVSSNPIRGLSLWKIAVPFAVGVTFHGAHIFLINNVQQSMTNAYRKIGGLPQVRFDELSDYLWYPKTLLNLFSEWSITQLVSHPRVYVDQIWLSLVAIVIIFLGIKVGARRSMTQPERLSALMFLAAFALASAGLYPVGGRSSLYLVPPVLLLVSFSLQRILDGPSDFLKPLSSLLALALLMNPMAEAARTILNPYDGQDTIWALESIEKNSGNSVGLLVDGPNRNQVLIHQAFGYAPDLRIIDVSLESTRSNVDLSNVASSFWLLSTHRINEAEEIIQNLSNYGYQVTCEFSRDRTYLVRLDLPVGEIESCALEK